MRPTTPRGFRDVLFQEAAERGAVVESLRRTFESWGYRPVETPVVERLATLEAGAGTPLEGTVLTLVDSDGSVLALRPEMTVPVARVVGSRLAGEPGPWRICYATEVFREQASLRGQAREFAQAGLELIGASGAAADAEVVAILVGALRETGLGDLRVSIGSAGVIRALLAESGLSAEAQTDVMTAIHRRDLVRVDELLNGAVKAGVLTGTVAGGLASVLRARGDRSTVAVAREASDSPAARAALDELDATLDLLERGGVGGAVTVDLGLTRDFDYYTGLVVEAYVPGLGVPVGGGGRYDGVLGSFGEPRPAAGFAIGVERIQIALAQQGRTPRVRALDALVGSAHAGDAFAAAALLRSAGWSVALATGLDRRELTAAAALAEAAAALWAEGPSIGSLVPDGAVGSALDPADLPEPPSLEGFVP